MRTFKLPDLGEGLQEAEIVSWHVAVGDRVVADQPVVSVETAKAVVEIPAPWPGRIVKQHAAPGDIIAIGSPLVDLETEAATTDAGTVVGTLPRAAVAATPPTEAEQHNVRPDAQVKASPAVRRRAQELGVDLARVTGTGPGGSIARKDLEVAIARPAADDDYEPLRGVRRAMAESMARAGAEVVPATVTDEAIVQNWPADADVTVRVVRAVSAGCRAAPALNAWLDGARMARRLHHQIDLGIAMETEEGLFAPTLRDVGSRSEPDLRAMLEAMRRDVAARTMPLSELRGQTLTLSNFGMLGGLQAALVIVPPQVAILGVGRLHAAARVIDGEVRAARVLPLSLTFDHRAVTGAEAIRFLGAVISDLTA